MKLVSGIQQAGIGVEDAHQAWAMYRRYFYMDVPVFEDEAEATLMGRYTGGKIYNRLALLVFNMNGGGGLEIWQYKNRKPQPPVFPVRFGDLGINAVKIKCRDIRSYAAYAQQQHIKILTGIADQAFYIKDEAGNCFQVKQADSWFQNRNNMGGVFGAVIGVSDLGCSANFYCNTLGYEKTGEAEFIEVNGTLLERVILKHYNYEQGAFSRLLGDTEIELVKRVDGPGQKIYTDRYWGDLGFIHLCFDVNNMDALKSVFDKYGHQFTVDSAESFRMGKAAGRFAYVEDPDGTLIELVETHKIPILKKLGIYLKLKEKYKRSPLPDWQVKLLSLSRKRD